MTCILYRHLRLYALTIQWDILPRQLRQTIDKCEFKHKSFELISGPVLPSLWRGGGWRRRKLQCCMPQQAQSVDIHTCESVSSSLREAAYWPKAAYDIHVSEAISQPLNSHRMPPNPCNTFYFLVRIFNCTTTTVSIMMLYEMCSDEKKNQQ